MHKNRTLFTIGLVIFLDNIGAGMVMPLLPTLFMNDSIGLAGLHSMTAKSFYFGLSYMLFPIIAIISNPYLGYLSDYKGRKFVITFGIAGFTVTNLITIVSIVTHNLWLFLLTRLILGFFGGSYTAATAALMDISADDHEKIRNIKFINLLSVLGFIISPVFSILVPTKLTSWSLTIPFVMVFLLSILNLILIILFFPKTKQAVSEKPQPKIFNMIITSFLFIFKTPAIFRMGIVFFLFQLGYSFYLQIVAMDLQQIHGFSIRLTGTFFLVVGICYTAGMYMVHSFFNRYYSNRIVTKISLIASSIFIGCLSLNEFGHLPILLASYSPIWVLNILLFIMLPTASINIYKQFISLEPDNQGLMMGAVGQISSLALIASALLISVHVFFGHFSLLIPGLIMLAVFIVYTQLV